MYTENTDKNSLLITKNMSKYWLNTKLT